MQLIAASVTTVHRLISTAETSRLVREALTRGALWWIMEAETDCKPICDATFTQAAVHAGYAKCVQKKQRSARCQAVFRTVFSEPQRTHFESRQDPLTVTEVCCFLGFSRLTARLRPKVGHNRIVTHFTSIIYFDRVFSEDSSLLEYAAAY
jgi:hypothetical protein